jgi:ferredoxin
VRIDVDRDRCEGHSLCEDRAPATFSVDDEGRVTHHSREPRSRTSTSKRLARRLPVALWPHCGRCDPTDELRPAGTRIREGTSVSAVSTTSGRLVISEESGLLHARGVPYATARRFQRPEPVRSPHVDRDKVGVATYRVSRKCARPLA